MSKTVLLAGASGMLGLQIAQQLVNLGAHVRIMLRGGVCHPKIQSFSLLRKQGVEVVSGDVTVPQSLLQCVEGVDTIVSALKGTEEIIFDGQLALANAAIQSGVRRFFSSNYSLSTQQLVNGDHVYLEICKRADEEINRLGLPVTQIFSGTFSECIITQHINLIDYRSRTINYWGSADQHYDFTHSNDVAKFIARAALLQTTQAGVLNIYTDRISPQELLEILPNNLHVDFKLNCLGSLAQLNDAISDTIQQYPAQPSNWATLQYMRLMASGRGLLSNNGLHDYIATPYTLKRFVTDSLTTPS